MPNYKNKNQYNNSNNYQQVISHSIIDKNCSNEELYEKIGKYNTRKDENNEAIYYNDNNKYFKKKNETIEKFQINTIGFPNIGNSCYINSFLQILFHIPNF